MILNSQCNQLLNILSGVATPRTVLRSLLFLCYINESMTYQIICTTRVKLYADSVLLYSPVNTIADCQNLQEDLDRLMQWADTW